MTYTQQAYRCGVNTLKTVYDHAKSSLRKGPGVEKCDQSKSVSLWYVEASIQMLLIGHSS